MCTLHSCHAERQPLTSPKLTPNLPLHIFLYPLIRQHIQIKSLHRSSSNSTA